MNAEDFVQLLNANKCPDSISPHLEALWYDAKGNWNQAHTIVQRLRDQNAVFTLIYTLRKAIYEIPAMGITRWEAKFQKS